MKIGIDARMYGPSVSGIGNYVKCLINALQEKDHENEYVVFLLKKGYDECRLTAENFKKVLVDVPWYSWREQGFYWRIIKKEKLDVMHFPNFNVPMLFTDPYVVTIHDMTPMFFPGPKRKRSSLRRYAYNVVFQTAVKKAERVITVSHFSKDEIVLFFPSIQDKITVIPLGLNPFFQKTKEYDIMKRIKKRFGIHRPYIFYIGVWRDHKNIPGLIRSFQILNKKYPKRYQLVLAGDNRIADPKIYKTLSEVQLDESIVQCGFVSDEELLALYQGAEILVVPSFKEGFGLHTLESLACGTPVVASETTSIPEILNNAALYFHPTDIHGMAKVIERVLMNKKLREHLLQRGREIIQQYSWKSCAEKTLQVYQDIFHQRNTHATKR